MGWEEVFLVFIPISLVRERGNSLYGLYRYVQAHGSLAVLVINTVGYRYFGLK